MPGIDECLLEAMVLPGARGAAVVEWTSGLALGTVGDSPNGDHEVTAAETAELARMAAEHTAFAPPETNGPTGPTQQGDAGKGIPVEDVIITTRTGYHLLRFVETTFDSSVFVHLWLDREEGNLALARIRLQDLAERLALI
ncbi:hypothetical protein [Wenjunlia tyrosinilytica]|uniref:Uncharacterized protein n=1 Tax=Wenjunlia tyrosinilytica TaxID=1544741 RepID=A0A918DTV2_9ACTN|nr:hypothetical protein [Wenjunlia tyrosinilytica]GGO83081.1 hypothetical protein GCM10012280_11190 [Wenjunlia tyrosinilytica]